MTAIVMLIKTYLRWAKNHLHWRAACKIMHERHAVMTDTARLILWDGKDGGVGVIITPHGSVQCFVRPDGLVLEWFGIGRHPVSFDKVTVDMKRFPEALRIWTTPAFIDPYGTERGIHGDLF